MEDESLVLREWVQGRGEPLTGSELLRTEVIRACRRVNPGALAEARAVLAVTDLLPLTRELLADAAELEPSALRSLDAIHLASAVSIQDDLTAFVAYDRRLLEAARERGLPVVSPGT